MCVVYRKRRKGVECCSSSETFRSFFSCFLVKKQADRQKNQVKKADREKQKGGVKKKSILIKKVSRITTTTSLFGVCVVRWFYSFITYTRTIIFSGCSSSIIYCVFIVVSKSIVTIAQ